MIDNSYLFQLHIDDEFSSFAGDTGSDQTNKLHMDSTDPKHPLFLVVLFKDLAMAYLKRKLLGTFFGLAVVNKK